MQNMKIDWMKIFEVGLLLIGLLICILLFMDAYNEDYQDYDETHEVFRGLVKNESDSIDSIDIKTDHKTYRIDNIISDQRLYESLKEELNDGDEIIIYYYESRYILGITKGTIPVLEVEDSIAELEQNNQFSKIFFPVASVVIVIIIIYILIPKKNKTKLITPESTIKIIHSKGNKIIKPRIPISLLIIHCIVLLCTLGFITFLTRVNIWSVQVLIVFITIYNLYRFIGLFTRKIRIDADEYKAVFYTPFRKIVIIDEIESIQTIIHDDFEGIDRYFIKFKIKDKKRLIKFETTFIEQSLAIKMLFEDLKIESTQTKS